MTEYISTKNSAENPWNTVNIKKFMAIGGTFSACQTFMLYPLELLKTRLQVQRGSVPQLRTTIDTCRRVLSTQGIRGLYHGWQWSVLGGIPSSGAYFISYNILKRKLLDTELGQANPVCVYALSGIAAELVSLPLWVPLDILIQRIQVATAQANNHVRARDVMRDMRKEGLRGVYRGTLATIIVYAPGSALWWAAYEVSKFSIAKYLHHEDSPVVHAMAGGIAGLSSALFTNPLDVIKTRVQANQKKHSYQEHVKMLKGEGSILNFYKGIVPRAAASSVKSAITFVVYETAMRWSKE
eukprot:GILJ01007174.1.p1 GENE.GILJ01007174.1~~GILJ01007174.1.p1  ORF type:complete len:335 (+),score=24.25 GILJ01007174.1:117-1007(+)